MKPTYELRHINDLPPNLQKQMLDVIGNRHLPESEWHPFGLSNGCVPVALVKKGPVTSTRTEEGLPAIERKDKVIAAIVTDGRQRVHWWAGRLDKEFLKEHHITPAAAIMGAFLSRLGTRNPTFAAPLGPSEGNLIYNRVFGRIQDTLKLREGTYTVALTPERKAGLKKDIPTRGNAWRKYRPYK